MALGLSHLIDMKKSGSVCVADFINSGFKYLTHASIIPGLYAININTILIAFLLETFQRFRDGIFCCLVFFRNRNPVSVIPYKKSNRHLLHGCCVYCFPKMTFACGCIADGTKTDFVAVV